MPTINFKLTIFCFVVDPEQEEDEDDSTDDKEPDETQSPEGDTEEAGQDEESSQFASFQEEESSKVPESEVNDDSIQHVGEESSEPPKEVEEPAEVVQEPESNEESSEPMEFKEEESRESVIAAVDETSTHSEQGSESNISEPVRLEEAPPNDEGKQQMFDQNSSSNVQVSLEFIKTLVPMRVVSLIWWVS